MLLRVIPMICFEFFEDFGEKSQKEKTRKFGQTRAPTAQRGMPSPRRGQGAQNGTPRVRYGVALLRRGVDTVHCEKISDFCF